MDCRIASTQEVNATRNVGVWLVLLALLSASVSDWAAGADASSSAQQTTASLRKDWFHQADNRPTQRRTRQEIKWARQLAERMAEFSDLPVKKVGAQPGSLGSYAGLTLGIPIITLELRGEDSRLNGQLLWQRYGKMLIAAVVYPDKWQ